MAKILELHFGISPSYKYPGLISFRIDCIDHLAVGQQGLLSLLQHHDLNASILRYSAFFMAQLLHPYMTTGKSIGLTLCMDLCWQSWILKHSSVYESFHSKEQVSFNFMATVPSTMILETKKIKYVTASTFSPLP